MAWLESSAFWIAGVFLVFLGGWLRNLFSLLVPSPQRTILALKNLAFNGSVKPDKVRFILGWLENDYAGKNTAAVSNSFVDVAGIELCRSARIVAASGAADAWRADMRQQGRKLLEAWHADIAVVGRVDKDGDALSLWFISSGENDTLGQTSNNLYTLQFNRLNDNFLADMNDQVCAFALSLAIPKTTDGKRRQLGLQQLKTVVPKLENLFRTLSVSADRTSLCTVYSMAQSFLGEWLGETERLRSAIDRSREVLDAADQGDAVDAMLVIRFYLGRTLYILGEREGKAEYLAESIRTLEEALDQVDDREGTSIVAGIKGLMGNVLRTLGNIEGNTQHLHRAVELLESALEIHQREGDVPYIAISQNNLGLVHMDLGEAEKREGAIWSAISLLDESSILASREDMVTLLAMTNNNIGQAHEALAELSSDSNLIALERSRAYYEKAVNGYSKSVTPFHWASAKRNLGRVLTKIGTLSGSIDHLKHAIRNLQEVHSLSSQDTNSMCSAATCAGLGSALFARGRARANPRDIEDAVVWFNKALNVYRLDANTANWIAIKNNLAMSFFVLAEMRAEFDYVAQGFSSLEEIFVKHDLRTALANHPEVYATFTIGIDLVKSMDHESDYVDEWTAKWVPVFEDREHENVPRHMLAIIQNNIATILQDRGELIDAIKLCRHALTNLAVQDEGEETTSSSISTFCSRPDTSQTFDASRFRMDVKRNLGTASRMLGEKRASASLLREAITLFDEILDALDRTVEPMEWVITQSSKARAYKELYRVEGNVDLLRCSLAAYDEAVQNLVEGVDSPWHRQVPGKREEVRELLEREVDNLQT